MSEVIKTIATEIDVLDKSLYNYDKSDFALALFEKSQSVLMDKVTRLIEMSPAFAHFLKSIKPTQVFDVNMSNTAKEMYRKGDWLLKYSKTKDGLIPILCNKAGKFIEFVTLNPKNISPDLSGALTNLSMQQQLGQLMDQIERLSNSIQRIERGQRDDRISLFYSARQQYIEAISMSNYDLQSQALLYAAHTANDARFQLMQTMRSDVEQIVNNKKLKKNERDELSNNVREAMQYINEATGLCVISYSALGETKPMLAALKSYQCFIEQTLLSKSKNDLTKAQELHRNWNGSDNEWLKIPQIIVDRLDEVIMGNNESPVLIER